MKRLIIFFLAFCCGLVCYGRKPGFSQMRTIKKGECVDALTALATYRTIQFEKNDNGIYLHFHQFFNSLVPIRIFIKHSDGNVDILEDPYVYYRTKENRWTNTIKREVSCRFNVTKVKMSNVVKMRAIYNGEPDLDFTLIDIDENNVNLGEGLSQMQKEAIDEYKVGTRIPVDF